MKINLFWLELNNLDMNHTWFQQDDATCYTANDTIVILHERFEGRVNSCKGNCIGHQDLRKRLFMTNLRSSFAIRGKYFKNKP